MRGAVGGSGAGRGAGARDRGGAAGLTARALGRVRSLARPAVALGLTLALASPLSAQRDVVRGPRGDSAVVAALEADGAERLTAGRFTVVAFPSEAKLARSLLEAAQARDTFPGLPRPRAAVLIAVAPDEARFRAWAGPSAPAWGAAVAFPSRQRIVMQGQRAGSDAGSPVVTLRHELAHLALAEALGDLPPRWFDEGYASVAAGEWDREDALATSVGLAVRGTPSLDALEQMFYRGAGDAELAYALAHRAVADLMVLDPTHGLTNFFAAWGASGSFEVAVRQAFGRTATDFERTWQQRTRRRYGALALLANLSLAFGLFTVVIGPFLWQRRRRDRARLAALRQADARQEAEEQRSALDAMLALAPAGGDALEARYDDGPNAPVDRVGPSA